MGRQSASLVIEQVRTLCVSGAVGVLTDAELVERFVTRDGPEREDAFSVLVQRHGPMVLRVCRRMLGGLADAEAEDVFQAVFLVLARKARTLRKTDRLQPWLYGVAVRSAKEARRRAARRQAREGGEMDESRAVAAPEAGQTDWLPVLDEELDRLPERFRLPVLLCDLEGLSRRDAAQRLGIPEGTLSSRLSRGRTRLRDRLSRRGVVPGEALAGVPVGGFARSAVPCPLVRSTVHAALKFSAGGTAAAGAVPVAAESLAKGVLTMLFASKLKLVLLASVALALTAGITAGLARAGGRDSDARSSDEAEAKAGEKARGSMLVHVVGPDGQPLSGVKVLRSVWTQEPIKDHTRNFVSDDKGQVRVDLPEGMYIFRLWARKDGYVPLYAHWEEEDKPDTSLPKEFTLRLERGTVIGGVVEDPDGKPVAGASVEVELEDGKWKEARTQPATLLANGEDALRTDGQGRWTLDNVPAGDDFKVRVLVSHPDYISDPRWGVYQDEQGVDMKALRVQTATISMKRGLVVTGTVVDTDGRPVSGAVVVRGRDRPLWQVGSREVRTDNQGRYQLPPLSTGETVSVIAKGWSPA